MARHADQRACEIDPRRNGSCLNAARESYLAGDWPAVINDYVLANYPDHPDDWVRLIRAAQHLGRNLDAQRFLARAQTLSPADYARLLNDGS